jgi:DNA polymerase
VASDQAPVEDLADLIAAARACEGCELFAEATQTVFG